MFKRFSICYILLMFCITGTSAQEDRWTGNATNLSKGNLRVNSSGRYLEYSDGTPFLYMGDTAWELISRLNDKETELYLENRREKGFTVIQTVILDELDDMDVSSNGEPKLIDGNIDKPAPGYFTHVDKVISLAAAKGLYIALLPTWGDKVDKQWGKGPEIFTPENAYRYGKWLGERYLNAPNLIWIIGGDRSGDGKNFAIWNALATGIKSVDKNHLMTYHPHGEHSSSFWFHNASWLDFNMCQSGHAQQDFAIYQRLLLPDLKKEPHKPCMDGEPRYENIPINFKKENGRFGEEELKELLSEFSCSKNADVERFLKEQAIEFAKKNQSVTYLVFHSQDASLVGYFTLAIKPICVSAEKFSNTTKRKIARVSEQRENELTYTLSAYLIAQLGKNFRNGANRKITGKQLLQAAVDTILKLQYMTGGMVFFLEAENEEHLLQFYEVENGFKRFAVKETNHRAKKSQKLIQLLKVL